MNLLEASVPNQTDRTIPRLIFAACCVILFALGAGALLNSRINKLIEARNWSEHSLQVQANLQSTLLRLDRLDSLVHLYLVTRAPGTLHELQNLGIVLESNVRHLSALVADNRRQDENVRQLNSCAAALVEATRSLDTPNAVYPSTTQLACREVTVLMQEQERVLADGRSLDSENTKLSLLVVGLSLACFSILVVVVLFGVLVRDALFRRHAEEQLSISNGNLATTIQTLEDRAAEMNLLSDVRDQFQMCSTTKDAYDIAVHFIAKLLPGSRGALCMIDNSRQMIELRTSWGNANNIVEMFTVDACCGMRSGQIRWRTPDTSMLHCEHFLGAAPERYLCMPLVAHGETLGVLYVECVSDQVEAVIRRHQAPLRALLQLTSMTVAAVNLRSKLENQSIRDSLTGLFNRHFMEITLEREIRRASRRKTSLAVFMIDADNFKQFNDTFGHKAGDIVLRAIADRFVSSVRSEDIVCRYGGEEFVIILPEISPEKAAERAQNVCESINGLRVSEHGQTYGAVTVSIGVAMYPQDGRVIEQLLQASDRSLYVAKNCGRNQVAFAAQAAGIPIIAR